MVPNDGSTGKGSPATSEGSGKGDRSGAGLDLAGIDIAFEALLVCNTITIYHSVLFLLIIVVTGLQRRPNQYARPHA